MKISRAGRCREFFSGREDAQGMVFGAISMFMLVFCAALCYNVGTVTSRRVQIQNAADAAVFSAALVQANVVSNVAWLNDGMAFIYYNAMRYAVDVITTGVLAELKEHNTSTYYIDPTDAVVGMPDPVGHYNQAYQKASEMLPRCENWLTRIARMERAIATTASILLHREAARTAVTNGVQAMAYFPSTEFYPRPGSYVRLDIEKLFNGWRVTSNDGYKIEAINIGPWSWQITTSDGTQMTITKEGEGIWRVKTGDLEAVLQQHSPKHISVKVNKDDTTVDAFKEANGWHVFAHSSKVDVEYKPFRDGGYLLTVNGDSVGVRQKDGKVQQWTDNGWQDVPGQKNTVKVGGQDIPVNFTNHVELPGGASLDLPGTLNIGPMSFDIPDTVRTGNTRVKLMQDKVRIEAFLKYATFLIHENGSFLVNGLGTRDADGRWRPWHDQQWSEGTLYDYSSGRARHRLYVEQPDAEWIYEFRRMDTKFVDEVPERFGHHAIEDNDEYAQGHDGKYPEWAYGRKNQEGWFDPARGESRNLKAYYQTRPCWNVDDLRGGGQPPEPNGLIPTINGPQPCPTCNPASPMCRRAGDRLDDDGDGRADVRKYQEDIRISGRRVAPGQRYFQSVGEIMKGRQVQEGIGPLLWSAELAPLRLSADYFKMSINLGVWHDSEEPLLQKRSPAIPGFTNPGWGYYAVASARVGFLEKSEDGLPQHWRFNFDTPQITDEWAETAFENLYEPTWSARIVSTHEAVRLIDLEIWDQGGPNRSIPDNQYDSGTNYVWRGLANANWFNPDPPETFEWWKHPRMDVPYGHLHSIRDRRGHTFDYAGEDLENVVGH